MNRLTGGARFGRSISIRLIDRRKKRRENILEILVETLVDFVKFGTAREN